MWVSCLEELSTDHTLRIQNIIQLLPRDDSSRQTGSQTATRTPVGSLVRSRDWGHSSVGRVHVQHGQDSELCSLPRATGSQAPWNMPEILLLGGGSRRFRSSSHPLPHGEFEDSLEILELQEILSQRRERQGKANPRVQSSRPPKSEIQKTKSLSLNKSPKRANALKLWRLLISTSVIWKVHEESPEASPTHLSQVTLGMENGEPTWLKCPSK